MDIVCVNNTRSEDNCRAGHLQGMRNSTIAFQRVSETFESFNVSLCPALSQHWGVNNLNTFIEALVAYFSIVNSFIMEVDCILKGTVVDPDTEGLNGNVNLLDCYTTYILQNEMRRRISIQSEKV